MGETPLYQAVDMEQIEHVKLLLKHKADPNLCQTDGLTPLHIAVNKQNVQIVQCLLSSNANPNMKSTCYGQTPVHFAIKNNVNPTILLLLVQYNGSLVIKDKTEKRPIDYANSDEMKETLKKLRLQKEDIFRTPQKDRSLSFTTPKNITSTISKQIGNKISSDMAYRNIDIYSNTTLQDPGEAHFNFVDYRNKTNSDNKNTYPYAKNENNSEKRPSSNNKHQDMAILRKDLFNTNDKKKIQSESDMYNTTNKKDYYYNNCLSGSMQKRVYQNQYYTTDKKIFRDIRYSPIEEMKEEDGHDNDSSKSVSIKKKLSNKINDISTSFLHVTVSKNNNVNNLAESLSYINNKENLSPNEIKQKYSSNTMKEHEINFNQETFKKISITKEGLSDVYSRGVKNNLNNQLKEDLIEKKLEFQIVEEELKNKRCESEILPITTKFKSHTVKPSFYQKPYITKTSGYSYDFNHFTNNSKNSEVITFKTQNNQCFTETNQNNSLKINNNYNQIQNVANINVNTQTNSQGSNTINNNSTLCNNNVYNTTGPNNRVNTTNVEFTSNYNSNKVVETIYYSTNENTKFTLSGVLANNQPQNLINISAIDSSKLYEWLREINLLCYYPLFIEKGIYSLENIIEDMKREKIKLTAKDVSEIGIKKPGHIFRILVKLEIDSGLINKKIYELVIKAKNTLKTSCNIKISKEYFCGCNISNEKTVSSNSQNFDLVSWLKKIDLIELKDNFLYNGYEMVEFFVIQMFSSNPIDEFILKEYLHIYSEKHRDIIIMQLNKDVKYIMKKINSKMNSMEFQKEMEETNCKVCVIF